MSLRLYRRARMVALNSSASALEAGRAIENNNIGAVLIHDGGRLIGIVTDRDLATRVVGQGLDPKRTSLADIMTVGLSTLAPSDSQEDALRVMTDRRVRRVPLVEGERLVGVVTLDDLLLDEAAPLDDLAAVVEAQIGAGGPAAPARTPALRRRAARAEASYARLVTRLGEAAVWSSREQAELALEIVLSSVLRRLTPGEAKNLSAQLPSLLRRAVDGLLPGPDKLITAETITAELSERLQLDGPGAEAALSAVASALNETVSPGQMDDVRAQLPQDLRAIFSIAPPAAAAA